jgi:zinc protease
MLKRFFIPVLLVLVLIAGGLYWLLGHSSHRAQDVRKTVPVERFSLRNGMTVVVMPNDRLPAVTHILFVRAGGADDTYGKTGVAHFLEHLMFSGTKNYPEGAYDRSIARMGGEQNAYTTRDYTAYYATVPADQLQTVMAMDADRLMNLSFDTTRVKRELKVITEERASRVDNQASAVLSEQLDALTFLNHPYHHPLIGWAEDMKNLTEVDARNFFRAHYRAPDMVLVVAGDVDASSVRRLAQKYYGPMPAGQPSVRQWPQEPPLKLVRHAQMQDSKAKTPRLIRQYVAPSLNAGETAQAMPLSLMAQYLGGSSTSLLYRRLVVEQKLASDVSVSYDPLNVGPSLFRIVAVPVAGTSLETLEKALDGVLNEALAGTPAEADVVRAKTQLKAEVIFAQDGLGPLAHLMGELYMIGKDEQYFYGWSDAVNTVQTTDMLSAARQVLDPALSVTGYLLPTTTAAAANAAAPVESAASAEVMP